MGEIVAGRMGVHFVMVLVGLLEASIAARREQDYYYCLPIEWKLHLAEYFFTVRATLSFFGLQLR